jgi:ring-1,2-phenylacetyl-CoA epoxidase subunit PaaD
MLSVIPDPEIPVVNIFEMGMLRDVVLDDGGYEVILTPTYTGCPAMSMIEADILATLAQNGVKGARVKMVLDPAWTTDWMSGVAKDKLLNYGIAPPLHSSCNHDVFGHNIIKCPRCHSDDTVMLSRFGATACKALYQCNDCKEPFEYFKCH